MAKDRHLWLFISLTLVLLLLLQLPSLCESAGHNGTDDGDHTAAGAGVVGHGAGEHAGGDDKSRSAHDNSTAAGDDGHGGDNSSTHGHGEHRFHVAQLDFAHVSVPYIICMWIFFASLAKIGFHLNNKLSSIFPESCLLILLGVIVGLALFFTNTRGYELDSDVFFLFLLPPIILEAGYFMPIRAFFDNIGTILTFAVIGTLMNTFLIGFSIYGFTQVGAGVIPFEMDVLHCLTFAALISAVDPVAVLAVFEEIHVNENLHICVFGESLLNDAVTVVLYHMFETFSAIGRDRILTVDIVSGVGSFFVVGIGGTLIGVIFGLIASFVTRFTDHVRVIEPLLVFVLGYLSYLTAEIFHLSGIMACVFCGITMKKYVEANISRKSHTTIKYFMKMLASICETIIFMFLGLSTVVDDHVWDTAFVLLTLLFCLLYRAFAVILQCLVANAIRTNKLSMVDQFIMAYGGLRGAIAFSLAVLLSNDIFPQKQLMVTTTLVVVYFTVFIQGTTIKPLVGALHVKLSDKHKPSMNEKIHDRSRNSWNELTDFQPVIDHLMAGIEDLTGNFGHHEMRVRFHKFENNYLKPLLLRKTVLKYEGLSIVRVFETLTQRDASEYISKHGSFGNLAHGTSDSFANLYASHVMSQQSVSSIGQSQPDLGDSRATLNSSLPIDNGSSTVLDMQALDHKNQAQESRKMKDDSKIHHILDDAMFNIRKRFHRNQRHTLPDSASSHVFQHNVRKHLHKLMSHHHHHHNHHHGHRRNKKDQETEDNKPKKNVSFASAGNGGPPPYGSRELAAHHDISSDDEGITFTVHKRTDEDGETESVPESTQSSTPQPSTPTIAETTLPWKNFVNRREPVPSATTLKIDVGDEAWPCEVPSWAVNPDYVPPSPASLGLNGFVNMNGGTRHCAPPSPLALPASTHITGVHLGTAPPATRTQQQHNMANNSKPPKNGHMNENHVNNLLFTKASMENDILRTKKIDDIHENGLAVDNVENDGDDEEEGEEELVVGSSARGVLASSIDDESSSDDAFAADLTFLPRNQVDCYLPATWRTNVENDLSVGKTGEGEKQGDSFDASSKAPQGALPPPWKNHCDEDDEAAQKSNVMFAIGGRTESLRPVPWDSLPNSSPKPPLPSDVAVDIFGDLDLDDIDKSSMKCLSTDSQPENDDCIPPPWRVASVVEGNVPVRSPSASHELDSLVPQASQNSLRLSEAESRHSEQFRGHHHVIDIGPRELEHSNSSGALSAMVDVEHDQLDLISRVELWLIGNKPEQQDPVLEDQYGGGSMTPGYHDEIESSESGDIQDTYL